MTLEELHRINSPEIREIIQKHKNDDPAEFALKNSGNKKIPSRAIAEQIYCYQRAVKKLPQLSQNNQLYEKTALEQSSGEITASFKASSVSGEKIIDLTGGLGIDSIHFSQEFDSVIYCESDPLLYELFKININTLNINNITAYNTDSIELLKSFPDDHFDWIYVDPSRRNREKRILNPQNYSPNIIEHQELFLQKAKNVMIKLSPADEPEEIKKQLNNINELIVVSVDNECKEILVYLKRKLTNTDTNPFEAVLLNSKDHTFRIFYGSKTHNYRLESKPLKYLYEPDAAIIKARITPEVAEKYFMRFLKYPVDYLTSEELINEFPGRKFFIKDYFPYNKKHLKEYFTTHNINKSNFARRDFPDSPEVLHTKYKITDGGSDYFFFTKSPEDNLIVIHCIKPDSELEK